MRRFHPLIFLLLLLCWTGCQRDQEVQPVKVGISEVECVAEDTAATLSARIISDYPLPSATVQYSLSPVFDPYDSVQVPLEDLHLNTRIGHLESDTTYYVRFVAVNTVGRMPIDHLSEFHTGHYTGDLCEPSLPRTSAIGKDQAQLSVSVNVRKGAILQSSGICYATTPMPTLDDHVINAAETSADFTCTLYGLASATTYYVRPWVRWQENIEGEIYVTYGPQLVFTTEPAVSVGTRVGGYQAVDLGLSVLWATMNVGAERSENAGNYYAWGETETKGTYSYTTYKYYADGHYTKYFQESSGEDILTTLEDADDAVCMNWGNGWYLPTLTQCEELFDNCLMEYVYVNGVRGIRFTSKINGNTLFLPQAGCYVGAKVTLSDSGLYLTRNGNEIDHYVFLWQDSTFGDFMGMGAGDGYTCRGVHAPE